ncbi:hypothetical protein EV175_002600 [Coemansia sp. RSA 1933]|nr:hypothetical protein EV175_002600 [Coemansia sp. RSA 1933]
MASNNDECAELQRSEMDVLEAIYDEREFSYVVDDASGGLISGTLEIQLDEASTQELLQRAKPTWMQENIEFLPPLYLDFQLPRGYPLNEAPVIHISCIWLSPESTREIERRLLTDIWAVEREAGGVLSSYIDVLRYGLASMQAQDTDYLFDVSSEANVSNNRRMKRERFEAQSYTCPICLEEQAGLHCLQFECTHVHCKACLSRYFGMLVDEGHLENLGCPHPDCIKDPSKRGRLAISHDRLVEIITTAQLARYDHLNMIYRVDSNGHRLVSCPRTGCGLRAERDKKVDRLCVCACGYAFCLVCLKTWHGVGICKDSYVETMINEYKLVMPHGKAGGGDKNALAKWKETTGAKYGVHVVEWIIRYIVESRLSREFIEKSTKLCPKCKWAIHKESGCNHMTCLVCKTHFCYLCGNEIGVASGVYDHFNTNGGSCHQQLFGAIDYEG